MILDSGNKESKLHHPVIRVLAFLAEQKIATIHQIHQYCFPGQTERYARHVLTKTAGYRWVSTQAILGRSNKLYLAYKLTKSGFEEFRSMTGLELKKIQTGVNSREHDITLTDIRLRFSKCNRSSNYLSENILKMGIFEGTCPLLVHFRTGCHDGAVQLVTSDKKIWMAVEYERSDKTADRNIERFRSWYQAEELNGILLIAEDESFMGRLIEVDRQTYPNLKRKILFSSLRQFLANDPMVSFQSSQQKKLVLTFGTSMNIVYPILDRNLSI